VVWDKEVREDLAANLNNNKEDINMVQDALMIIKNQRKNLTKPKKWKRKYLNQKSNQNHKHLHQRVSD